MGGFAAGLFNFQPFFSIEQKFLLFLQLHCISFFSLLPVQKPASLPMLNFIIDHLVLEFKLATVQP